MKYSPVVCANGIQNILDPILPLHALLAFVYHRRQVLHMGFGRKRTPLSSPFSLTFRNVKPILKVLPKKCINLQMRVKRCSFRHWSTLILATAWTQNINAFHLSAFSTCVHIHKQLSEYLKRFTGALLKNTMAALALPRQTAKWLLVQMRKSKSRCW